MILPASIADLPRKTLLAMALQEKVRRQRENRLQFYQPYGKQLDFHAASLTHRERLFMAGNQLGKTLAGAMEAACHATGKYPEWWKGRKFTKATAGWASGITSESVRDTVQRLLLGRPGEWGTGSIPKDCIEQITMARGIANAVDTVTIRHVSGGLSTISFKSYEKGREKWQGETLDWVWFDEEPPPAIYTEGLTRTNATNGIAWMTFTPLLGMSDVVRRFLIEKVTGTTVITMTIYDVAHYTPEQCAAIIAAYPAHERDARSKGTPTLGSGRIFPVMDELIAVDAFPIPKHWVQSGALDFGWDHPTAAIKLAWDRDNDCVYITHCYRLREATPLMHAATLKAWGAWLPWAWPHDGLQHDKGSGEQLAEQYRTQGLAMMDERATFEDGSNGVEAGLMEMLDRMNSGRFKVFKHLNEWFEEFRLYHRKEGKVVKEADDIMSASRYGVMMLRNAITEPKPSDHTRRKSNWRTA